MTRLAIIPLLLAAALGGCRQGVEERGGGEGVLIATTAARGSVNAAEARGRFTISGRCLLFVSEGETYLPVFDRPVRVAARGEAANDPAAIMPDETYTVTGSPYAAGAAPRGLAEEVAAHCRYPAFAIGGMRRGEPPPPPPPPQ